MLYLSNWSIIFTRIFTVKCTFAKKRQVPKMSWVPKKSYVWNSFGPRKYYVSKINLSKFAYLYTCILAQFHNCILAFLHSCIVKQGPGSFNVCITSKLIDVLIFVVSTLHYLKNAAQQMWCGVCASRRFIFIYQVIFSIHYSYMPSLK